MSHPLDQRPTISYWLGENTHHALTLLAECRTPYQINLPQWIMSKKGGKQPLNVSYYKQANINNLAVLIVDIQRMTILHRKSNDYFAQIAQKIDNWS